MVADGMGIGFTTAHTGKTMPEGLCYVPITGMEKTWTVSLYRRRSKRLSEEERQFLEFVERLYLKGLRQHKV
jgi:DNA-binding transcriptional LysR family regulator